MIKYLINNSPTFKTGNSEKFVCHSFIANSLSSTLRTAVYAILEIRTDINQAEHHSGAAISLRLQETILTDQLVRVCK